MSHPVSNPQPPVDVAVDDIYEAMRQQGAYLDVAPGDVLAIYRLAYAHAAARFVGNPPVSAIMTRTVVAATITDSAHDVGRRMAQAGVSGLPVLDGAHLAGVVSIKDLLRLLGQSAQASPADLVAALLDPAGCGLPDRQPKGQTPVTAIMTHPAITIGPETTTAEAARIMTQHGINRLPVVAAGVVCGMVSRSDVVGACSGEVCA